MAWLWQDKDGFTPPGPGWYAVLTCWDPDEGFFPGAGYWNGTTWESDSRATLWCLPEVFPDAVGAKRWAYDHDPEF